MKFDWLHQILTGTDNRTIAIGRWIGLILLTLAVFTPIAEIATVIYKMLDIHQWGEMLDQWQVYLPIITATAGGIIAGTAFTEPKPRKDGQDQPPQ